MVKFANKIHIAGDLTTTSVNGVFTDELITLNTAQNLTGELIFKLELNVLKDLNVDVVNKIPITEYVLRKQDFNITCKLIAHVKVKYTLRLSFLLLIISCFPSAHKTFNGSIHISGKIIMDDLILIDGVDPSMLNTCKIHRPTFLYQNK